MEEVEKRVFSTSKGEITIATFTVHTQEIPKTLERTLRECDRVVGLSNVVRQTFFLADSVRRSLVAPVVEKAYGTPLPATSYVLQPPAGGQALSCELWAFTSDEKPERRESVTLAKLKDTTWAFVGGLETEEVDASGAGTRNILSNAERLLRVSNLSLAQMVRTWYYIGNILGTEGGSVPYDRFNAARNAFYKSSWPDLSKSPASTGIGMRNDRTVFEGIVLDRNTCGSRVSWIDNPLQTPPYFYDVRVNPEHNPSFSRAAAVELADSVLIFISGTAGIRKSKVLHPEDADAQTRITIENIETLIGTENLVSNHAFKKGATPADLQGFRVYVKRERDFDVIRECCRRRLPSVPQTFVVADVCRPELLVEIEGLVAFKNR